jgi:hypothetical protein
MLAASASHRRKVADAAPKQHARVENGGVHGDGPPVGSAAEILSFSAERFERSGTRRLVPLVGDHRAHRNAMMGADHATRQYALLYKVQEISA